MTMARTWVTKRQFNFPPKCVLQCVLYNIQDCYDMRVPMYMYVYVEYKSVFTCVQRKSIYIYIQIYIRELVRQTFKSKGG